ncbi:MAG: hypothetical protein Q4Q58_01355 [Thermoplasmata archaeon]|nr:hypothetical protein [Thermoplasmata archaeon]
MTSRVDFEITVEGARITKLGTTERRICVPCEISGYPVTSIGPGFLSGSPGTNGRTLVIPASVISMDQDALIGTGGISAIEYGGDLATFSSFKLVPDSDCTLRCTLDGEPFEFEFMRKHPMSFPEFDDAVLSLYMRLTPEVAISRLSNPIGLTPENRAKYERFVSDRIMPRAEQAVSTGDTNVLAELFATGMVSDADLRRLLDRSLRSGRIGMTSMLMSETRRRFENKG